jgi:mitogen-activated protein kinase 1/3
MFKNRIASYECQTLEKHMTNEVFSRCYRAPEIILLQNDYGKAADIWALGLILAEMLIC